LPGQPYGGRRRRRRWQHRIDRRFCGRRLGQRRGASNRFHRRGLRLQGRGLWLRCRWLAAAAGGERDADQQNTRPLNCKHLGNRFSASLQQPKTQDLYRAIGQPGPSKARLDRCLLSSLRRSRSACTRPTSAANSLTSRIHKHSVHESLRDSSIFQKSARTETWRSSIV
jgi:hypothetical protein